MPCQSWSQLWSLALEKAHLLTFTCNSPFDFIFTDQPLSLMLIRTLLAELAAHSVPTFPNSALQDYWFFNTTLFTISRIYEVLARRNLLHEGDCLALSGICAVSGLFRETHQQQGGLWELPTFCISYASSLPWTPRFCCHWSSQLQRRVRQRRC